jgi:hypothetical protein
LVIGSYVQAANKARMAWRGHGEDAGAFPGGQVMDTLTDEIEEASDGLKLLHR